jgi:haloacid dehalogenase-like hydrolase
MPGSGARAIVNEQSVSVGGPHLLSELKVVVPLELEKAATAWASAGQTVLYVVVDGRVISTLAVEDEIRPESAQAVKELQDLGVRVAMITGDSHRQSRILLRSASSVLRSEPVLTSPSNLLESCSCVATRATLWQRSNCHALRTGKWFKISVGRRPTI